MRPSCHLVLVWKELGLKQAPRTTWLAGEEQEEWQFKYKYILLRLLPAVGPITTCHFAPKPRAQASCDNIRFSRSLNLLLRQVEQGFTNGEDMPMPLDSTSHPITRREHPTSRLKTTGFFKATLAAQVPILRPQITHIYAAQLQPRGSTVLFSIAFRSRRRVPVVLIETRLTSFACSSVCLYGSRTPPLLRVLELHSKLIGITYQLLRMPMKPFPSPSPHK